jgi:hypothetical protein
LILGSLVVLASACKPSTRPTEDDGDDPCEEADGGSQTKGKVVCDGLPPIEDGLDEYLDEESADEE